MGRRGSVSSPWTLVCSDPSPVSTEGRKTRTPLPQGSLRLLRTGRRAPLSGTAKDEPLLRPETADSSLFTLFAQLLLLVVAGGRRRVRIHLLPREGP